jgi:death on curing protein
VSRFLTSQEVVEINADTVRRHGGIHAIRDHAALEAAIGRPQSGYYGDVIEEAAALFESLSQNHPFVDGNKRTAFAAAAVFLMLNGQELLFDDSSAYSWLMNLYDTQRLNKAELDSWLRSHAHPR